MSIKRPRTLLILYPCLSDPASWARFSIEAHWRASRFSKWQRDKKNSIYHCNQHFASIESVEMLLHIDENVVQSLFERVGIGGSLRLRIEGVPTPISLTLIPPFHLLTSFIYVHTHFESARCLSIERGWRALISDVIGSINNAPYNINEKCLRHSSSSSKESFYMQHD